MSLFDKFAKLSGAKATSRTFKYERESTKVWVDGEEVDADDIDDNLLHRMVSDLGVSAEDLASIQVQDEAKTVLRSAIAELAEVRENSNAERVECPDCNRTVVNRTGACMYCGGTLIGTAEAADSVIETEVVSPQESERHAVDEKFFDGSAEETEQEQEAAAQDAYLQRLRRM